MCKLCNYRRGLDEDDTEETAQADEENGTE